MTTARRRTDAPTATQSDEQGDSASAVADEPTTQHASLVSALAAFQSSMPTVHKDKTAKVETSKGPGYSYRYADLADMTRAAMPLLASHGLSFVAPPRMVDGQLMLVGTLRHVSGDTDEGMLPIGGNTPQALGSSITYARRYLFGCMTGLITDDDDDGAAAERAAKEQQRLEREHAERVERERQEAREQRERDMQVATADHAAVEQLRLDVVQYADTIRDALARKESLLAVWSDATRAGALGCEVIVPPAWAAATNGPPTCKLHQLISGAADVTLPPSGETQAVRAEDPDPWATQARQQAEEELDRGVKS